MNQLRSLILSISSGSNNTSKRAKAGPSQRRDNNDALSPTKTLFEKAREAREKRAAAEKRAEQQREEEVRSAGSGGVESPLTSPRGVAAAAFSRVVAHPPMSHEELLRHIETSGTVTVQIVVSSVLSAQFTPRNEAARFPGAGRGAPAPETLSSFILRLPHNASVNRTIECVFDRYLELRRLSGLPTSVGFEGSVYKGTDNDEEWQLAAMQSDLELSAVCGTSELILSRVFRSKKAVVAGSAKAPSANDSNITNCGSVSLSPTVGDFRSNIHALGLAIVRKDAAEEDKQLQLSQKGIVELLTRKEVRPPFTLKIGIVPHRFARRCVMQAEKEERQAVSMEWFEWHLRASDYWREFLQEEVRKRTAWILYQAQERHRIHLCFIESRVMAEQRTVMREEEAARGALHVENRQYLLDTAFREMECIQLALIASHWRAKIDSEERAARQGVTRLHQRLREAILWDELLRHRFSALVDEALDLELAFTIQAAQLMDREFRLWQSKR